jgi:AcrB/AcrD/AcrF family protein
VSRVLWGPPSASAEATADRRSLVRLRAKRYGETSTKLEERRRGGGWSGGPYIANPPKAGSHMDGHEELRSAALLNGTSGITLVGSKRSSQTSVTVARTVKETLAELGPTLPPDIKAHIVGDQSEFIDAAVRSLEHHLVLASIPALAVILFFFRASIRTMTIAVIAVPVSIASRFSLIRKMGHVFNRRSLRQRLRCSERWLDLHEHRTRSPNGRRIGRTASRSLAADRDGSKPT